MILTLGNYEHSRVLPHLSTYDIHVAFQLHDIHQGKMIHSDPYMFYPNE
jgi:hypothetical protein